jgi:hypothetical protein
MPKPNESLKWEIAGFCLPNGDLDRPVKSDELIIFPAQIDGEDITWRADFAVAEFKRPGRTLLSSFLRLHNREPQAILTFVQTWGAVGFGTVFNFGSSLPPEKIKHFARNWIGDTLHDRHCNRNSACDPIEAYANLADHTLEILSLASDINDPAISKNDWEKRFPWRNNENPYGKQRAIEEVRFAVSWLARLGKLGFELDWEQERNKWQTLICQNGTLGALALQLTLAISQTDSLYTCTGCGLPYIRTHTHRRRPKPNQNNYCSNCGTGQARTDAKRRFRERIREARRLYAARIPIARIAEQLDSDPERVKTWVGEGHGQKTRQL